MNKNYECISCKYFTNKKSNMINHLNRKKKCNRLLESFIFTDEEIYNLSLIKHDYNNMIDHICNYCNKKYSNQHILEKHINHCKENKNKSHENIPQINIENIENNNIYMTQNINILLPFDKDWSTEHIDLYLKQLLLLADNKYTDLLKKILENKSNLNVILDKKTDIGYVYNSIQGYRDMDKSKIINMSMDKLYNQLNKIKEEVNINSEIFVKNINEESQKIEDRYNDYKNNKNTQKKVEECISDIFYKKKEEAHKLCNDLNIEYGY